MDFQAHRWNAEKPPGVAGCTGWSGSPAFTCSATVVHADWERLEKVTCVRVFFFLSLTPPLLGLVGELIDNRQHIHCLPRCSFSSALLQMLGKLRSDHGCLGMDRKPHSFPLSLCCVIRLWNDRIMVHCAHFKLPWVLAHLLGQLSLFSVRTLTMSLRTLRRYSTLQKRALLRLCRQCSDTAAFYQLFSRCVILWPSDQAPWEVKCSLLPRFKPLPTCHFRNPGRRVMQSCTRPEHSLSSAQLEGRPSHFMPGSAELEAIRKRREKKLIRNRENISTPASLCEKWLSILQRCCFFVELPEQSL